MKKWDDDQPVTYGMLKEVLNEAFTEAFAILDARIDAKIAASEERMLAAIRQSEANTAELISDLMTHIDARFNKIERDIKVLKKSMERLDNHLLRIGILETKPA